MNYVNILMIEISVWWHILNAVTKTREKMS